jgi:hypothetical protein
MTFIKSCSTCYLCHLYNYLWVIPKNKYIYTMIPILSEGWQFHNCLLFITFHSSVL